MRAARCCTLGFACALWISLAGAPLANGQSIIIGAGVQKWIADARSGRADMLAVGDSVTWAGGDGWDAGLIHSFANHIGLAGTGIIPDSYNTGEGEKYGAYGSWYPGFTRDPAAVPEAQRSLVWRSAVTANGAEPSWGFGWGIEGGTLDRTAAYDWHLWAAPIDSNARIGAYRRIYQEGSPISVIQTIPTIQLNPAPAGELAKVVMHFDASTSSIPGQHEMLLQDTSNVSVVYSRLIEPGAKGATVSSWGYGGHSTLKFLQERYLGELLDSNGRKTLLSNLVDSGGTKLNVLIAEGFNDLNETHPSVHGVTPGNSPAAFADNISSLMTTIRSDWTAGGHSLSNLSFTLLGMYDWVYPTDRLREFADELRQIALTDPQTAFIDLHDVAVPYSEAVAKGYILASDGVHPTYSGSLAYGDSVVSALLRGASPELGGDINLDGTVDVRDLVLLANNWQKSGLFLGGDFNGDGVVNATDLGIMALHWQAGAPALPFDSQTIPEPTSSCLVVLGCAAAMWRRPRARSDHGDHGGCN